MSRALTVAATEIADLFGRWNGVVLAVALPALLVVLVGQLRVKAPAFRILVAGEAEAWTDASDGSSLLDLLHEMPELEVVEAAVPARAPLAVMEEEGFDAILNLDGDGGEEWALYTAETRRDRLNVVLELAGRLDRAVRMGEERETGNIARATAIGALRPQSAHLYYPRGLDRSMGVLAITIGMIVCFLPFVLSAPSVVREREAGTLEVLLTSPRIGWLDILAGKLLATVVVTLLTFLVLALLGQTVYGVFAGPGTAVLLVNVVPAALASGALGLVVASTASSQSQALLATGIFFLALTIFTGIYIPLSESSTAIVALSRFLPLTFVYPAVEAWTAGAASGGVRGSDLAWLGGQCVLYGGLAMVAFRRVVRAL